MPPILPAIGPIATDPITLSKQKPLVGRGSSHRKGTSMTDNNSSRKHVTKKQGILAWHFLPADGRTANGENKLVVAGQTLRVKAPVELCSHGYHASVNPLDALRYAPGTMIQRCILWGDVEHGDDKLVASNRTCLWVVDAHKTLVEFACWCAEQAFDEVRKLGIEPDQRSIQAINVARLWIQDKATIEEVRAAAYAAYAAAYAAADAAADAARAAARAAAYAADAAADAARAAARAAAYAAAYAAAAAAAYAARQQAREKQSAKLEELLLALEPM